MHDCLVQTLLIAHSLILSVVQLNTQLPLSLTVFFIPVSTLLISNFIAGQFGLRNKREVWRVRLTLAKIRTAARELLTLEEKSPKRLFEGNALLRRLVRIGVLDESRMKLDYVLGLKVEDFMERRLQTQVFKLGLAKSIHHARVLIRHRHIRCDSFHVVQYLLDGINFTECGSRL